MNLIKRAGVYRQLAILTAMLILTALLSFPARAEEAESQHEHVRVGFFAMDGYHMMDEDGNRSGYGYDFLRLMARYWDADYEYIGYEQKLGGGYAADAAGRRDRHGHFCQQNA